MITVACTSCGAEIKAKDDAAGKRGKCPKCGAVVDIPGVPAPPIETQPAWEPPPREQTSRLGSAVTGFMSKQTGASETLERFRPTLVPESEPRQIQAAISADTNKPIPVIVKDVRIPLGSMVNLIIGFWIATIIAAVLVAVVVFTILAAVSGG